MIFIYPLKLEGGLRNEWTMNEKMRVEWKEREREREKKTVEFVSLSSNRVRMTIGGKKKKGEKVTKRANWTK